MALSNKLPHLNEKDILCCLPSFNLKMKRIFGRREKGKEDLSVDAVVVQKENLVEQLSQQERKFEESRSGMNRSIAVLERQELSLREEALAERRRQLESKKQANQDSQEKLQDQIKTLQMKLEEQRSFHTQMETGLEAEIRGMVLQVNELQESLNRRIQQFGEPVVLHTQVLSEKCVRRKEVKEGDQEDSGRESLASISTLVAQEEEKDRRERLTKRSSREKELVRKEERTKMPTWRRGPPASECSPHQYHQKQKSSEGGRGGKRESEQVDCMIATVQDLLRPA